jgi:uncharacterized protein YbbC (DUF1343 family)
VALVRTATSEGVRSALHEADLQPIVEIVNSEIAAGNLPGAVVLVGQDGGIVYSRAFGMRALKPQEQPMTADTIFDLASLTKVIATTTAVMQLVEQGKLHLDDPVAKYWPGFGASGKTRISIRHLLTHRSGLRPDLDLKVKWFGYTAALNAIIRERPIHPPGTTYVYSDINFEILGELVRRVSGMPLDRYCAEKIFKPLGMRDSGFRPSQVERERIAPTEYRNGKMLRGEVHDPTAYRMGGVAGHAGLFSSAADLAIFAQMLLDGGRVGATQILSPLTVEQMTTVQSPPNRAKWRGLGWDIVAPSDGEAFPSGAYGHTGFTGTSLRIDPVSRTYLIILTNRVHPNGAGDVRALRAKIATVVENAIQPPLLADQPLSGPGKVETGIDVLTAERFAPLSGLRVGIITNHSGIDATGRRTIDLFRNANGLRVAAIFSPEHGLYGTEDGKVASGMEPVTHVPIFSLYGDVRRPTPEMLEGLDALVFDIQDAGARFYTYATTMAYAMEAAAKKGIAFYVLDRPNPISGSVVQGPLMDAELKSFTGYFPLPVRHGMTMGELAEMFNAENRIEAKLTVIKMRNYQRGAWYDATGLRWIPPSPNLRTLTEASLYPGVAMVEGANLSVGRGTETPFEVFGAPWIDGNKLAAYLAARPIRGVTFATIDFTPRESLYQNRLCHGIKISLTDRDALDAPALGIEIASALYRLYPGTFEIDKTVGMIGARWVVEAIRNGEDPASIMRRLQSPLESFLKMRGKYLLYQ